MGNEIVYCCRCQTRLLSAEFEDGKAGWHSDKPYCLSCIQDLAATLPPEEEQRILEDLALKRAGPAEPPRRSPSGKQSSGKLQAVRIDRQPEKSPPLATKVLVSAGTAAVILIGAILVGRLREADPPSKPPERPPAASPTVVIPTAAPTTPAIVDPPGDVSPQRLEATARRALEKARDYGRANAADLLGRIALLEEAAWACRGTALAAGARKELDSLLKQRAESLAAELAPADAKARDAVEKGHYGDALALLQKERSRLAGADWTSAVDQKIQQVRQAVESAFASLRDKALQARRNGVDEEAVSTLNQVAAWGLEELTERLRSELAAIPLPAKPLPPEARAFLASWDAAFALARARDFSNAVRELEAAAALVTDPTLKKESALDLELLRFLATAHGEVLQVLVRSAKGQKVSVDVDGPAGKAVRVEGIVIRTAPTWMELRTESDAAVVEFDELAAGSLKTLLGQVPGRKPEANARAAGVFLLLEGEPSGLPPDAVSARVVAYGARVAQERSRPEVIAREAAARGLFEAAERDFNDLATKLESYNAYRALLASHGDTAFIRRKRSFIAQRLDSEKEAGKEYIVFADQLRPAGVFRLTGNPKVPAFWMSGADVPPEKDNYIDVTFSAKAGTEYRCWVFVGGCCAETFAFDVQGSEMGADPGGATRIPVKNAILFLKKTHALHGGRKEPTRFEWVPIPLPKYGSGGPKTLRLLSGQQGFSVAYALVSALRTAAPTDALAKEWERARLPVKAVVRDPSLVAWWTLDEGSGSTAFDSSSSRMPGTLRNNPEWTSGKRRGALIFDGKDKYVEIPKDPRLYLPGAMTVAAWVNVAALPTSPFGMYVVSDYAEAGNRSTFSLAVMPTGSAQFMWQEEQVGPVRNTSATALPLNTWVHLAGVWDGTTRTIYVNGAADGTNATPQARPDVGGHTAIGRPGACNDLYFNGKIDDVRLYNRALTAAEIQLLSGR